MKKLPHPRVTVKEWDPETGYPVIIEVQMSDNTIQEYERRIQQPKPNVYQGDVIVDLIQQNTYGGEQTPGYKGKHEKKSRRALATLNRPNTR